MLPHKRGVPREPSDRGEGGAGITPNVPAVEGAAPPRLPAAAPHHSSGLVGDGPFPRNPQSAGLAGAVVAVISMATGE